MPVCQPRCGSFGNRQGAVTLPVPRAGQAPASRGGCGGGVGAVRSFSGRCRRVLIALDFVPNQAVNSWLMLYPSLLEISSPASLTAWMRSSTTFFSVIRMAGPEIDTAATTFPV